MRSGMFGFLGAPKSRPWTPADLPTAPDIWVDWDSAITNVGSSASAVENRGALGGEFAQPTSSARPAILEDEMNGKRVLRFDGVNDSLYIGTGSPLTLFRDVSSGWVFSAYKKRGTDASPTNRALFVARTGADAYRLGLAAGGVQSDANNRPSCGGRRLDGNSYQGLNATVRRSEVWGMAATIASWGTANLKLLVDGELDSEDATWQTAGATSDTDSTYILIGSNTVGGTADCGDVDIAVTLAGSTAISDADMDRVHGWAAWELGIEDTLDASHPYRYTRPMVS